MGARTSKLFASIAALLIIGAVPAWTASAQVPAAGGREASLKAFSARVDAYVALKKRLSRGLAPVKPGDRASGKAEQHEDSLASRIEQARRGARPGDLFGDAARYIRDTVAHDTQARGTKDAWAAMQEVPAQAPPAINVPYHERAPLATVPPLILVNLPRLPDGLEYRFMGRDLILRDREANLILDYVSGAVPARKQ